VYSGKKINETDSEKEEDVVVKIMFPIEMKKILREVFIIEKVKYGPNIIKLLDITLSVDGMSEPPTFIFEYIGTKLSMSKLY